MSDKPKDGGPAFPQSLAAGPQDDVFISREYVDGGGMTLRDYFAGKAIVGKAESTYPEKAIAEWAYRLADAMIAEREKG